MNIRYTLKEANQALKLVRVIAQEMLERRTDRRDLARERAKLEAAQTPEGLRNELAELDARIYAHDEAIYNCTQELENLGLTILRSNPLTVHIPGRSLSLKARTSTSTNENVVFCWQAGEESVHYGHYLGEEELQRRALRVAKGA